jgi:GNAT superfamily N-acetyltransferase
MENREVLPDLCPCRPAPAFLPVPRPSSPFPALTTTYLETFGPPQGPLIPLPEGVAVVRAVRPTTAFYRFLYRAVGGPWGWTDRDRLSDDALEALVTPENVHVHVLYVQGTPAGYVELAYGPFEGTDPVAADEAQVVYFGLMPHAIGQGLGRAFLDWAVREAFAQGARRLWVHTCTNDHPRALGAYQAAGFATYRTETAPG